MAVRLVDGRTFSVPSDTRVLSKKKALIQRSVVLSSLPASYHSNTRREQALLEYSEHFRRQFIQLYPQHSELLLAPLNECGLRKFLPTSLCPTQLPHPDLYELSACAAFVADFLSYLPLDDTRTLPDYLPSLTSIVSIRAGDCLDMAALLCSLLRGSGHNAYLVTGQAEAWCCQGDESRTRCPLLPDEAAERRKKEEEKERKTQEDRARNRYLALVPQRLQHQSKFIAARQLEAAAPRNNGPPATADPLEAERRRPQAHAWVLVLPGRRDVSTALFVEPSTGAMWEVTAASHPYAGISSVCNEENVWVNVQEGKRTVREMGFDLSNSTHWLRVVEQREPQPKAKGRAKKREEEDTERVEEEKEAVISGPVSASSSSAKQPLLLPASWVSAVSVSRDAWQQRYPHGSKTIRYLNCTVEKFAPYQQQTRGAVLRIAQLDPVTGAPVRTEERFTHRADRLESRVTLHAERSVLSVYEKGLSSGLQSYLLVAGVRRELRFWPGSRVDGLVRRVELLQQKVTEEYEARDDRLVYRSIAVDRTGASLQQRQKPFTITIASAPELPIRKLTEKYSPDPQLQPEMDVVKRSHLLLDGLILLRYACCKDRLEGSVQIIDKNDKLENSDNVSAATGPTAGPAGSTAAAAATTTPAAGAAGGSASGAAAAAPAGSSTGSRARLDRKTRGWQEMTRGEEQVMMGRLLIVEKELKVKVKEREARMTELVSALDRAEEEQSCQLLEKVYDAAYHAALQQHHQHHTLDTEDDADAADAMSQSSNDYLTPFLLPFPAGGPLSRKQAEQVRSACLTALKERLLSRALILQQHLEDEQGKLAARQAAFKRQAGSGSVEANDEFQKFSEGCLFRIDILLARRARHEQMAVHKMLEMEQTINRDPRLTALHAAD